MAFFRNQQNLNSCPSSEIKSITRCKDSRMEKKTMDGGKNSSVYNPPTYYVSYFMYYGYVGGCIISTLFSYVLPFC